MKNKLNKSTLLALLSGVFAGSLVLSNILAGRVFDLGFWGLTLKHIRFIPSKFSEIHKDTTFSLS